MQQARQLCETCSALGERPRHLRDLIYRLRFDLFDGCEKVRMRHAAAEISPAHSFQNAVDHLLALAPGERPSRSLNEAVRFELSLLLDAVIDKRSISGVLGKSLIDLFGDSTLHDRLDNQSIELGMLRLFQPMVLEQTLELRIKALIIHDALDVVPQSQPLDMENRDPDAQWTVR